MHHKGFKKTKMPSIPIVNRKLGTSKISYFVRFKLQHDIKRQAIKLNTVAKA